MIRIAFFSPMPPSRSGIADYSEALLDELKTLANVSVFDRAPATFPADQFHVALYQLGNNIHHDFVWKAAVTHGGVPVLHEANLHHLVAEMTIKRNDWDGYLREVEFDAGPEALAFARRVRALETGPDYEGVPMLRRVLLNSRAVVVHSRCVEAQVRRAGFTGQVAVIPHGAWIPEADRMGFRQRLGVPFDTPLIGIFGHLKPYKRIAQSLRAFKRLLRIEPRAKMILCGEPHPDFPVESLIASLGIGAHVRLLGFTPIEDFVGYIAACDIILNLRYPTVGESSGTMLRSLGLGRAVVVSDVGSFAEYPDNICLKVPVDGAEEDTLFEYLNLLVSRPEVRSAMGTRARAWVEQECSWRAIAERYAAFLEAVATGAEYINPVAAAKENVPPPVPEPVRAEYLFGWAGESQSSRAYLQTHLTRLQRTLEIIPPGTPDSRVLEMGAYMQITPVLRTKLGYGEVRGCYYGPAGKVDRKEVESSDGDRFTCEIDLFDAERDRFPYCDDHFDTVLCCELIEHLPSDPMHMMSEISRILRVGGHLVLTTPNACSARAIAAILQGYHPGFFPAYIRPSDNGGETEARHAREYAPREIGRLFHDAGIELTLLETGEFRDEPHPEHEWVRHLLTQYELDDKLRGDGIYAVGVKRGPVRERFPAWLYD